MSYTTGTRNGGEMCGLEGSRGFQDHLRQVKLQISYHPSTAAGNVYIRTYIWSENSEPASLQAFQCVWIYMTVLEDTGTGQECWLAPAGVQTPLLFHRFPREWTRLSENQSWTFISKVYILWDMLGLKHTYFVLETLWKITIESSFSQHLRLICSKEMHLFKCALLRQEGWLGGILPSSHTVSDTREASSTGVISTLVRHVCRHTHKSFELSLWPQVCTSLKRRVKKHWLRNDNSYSPSIAQLTASSGWGGTHQ